MPVYLTCLSVEIAESTPVRGMDWIAVDLTRSEGEYILLLNVLPCSIRLTTSVGQRKNMTLPRGIEPQTFGFRAVIPSTKLKKIT